MDEEAHRVANPHRVDLGAVPAPPDERIIGGGAPVVVEPEHFPEEAVRILCVHDIGHPGAPAARDRNANRHEDLAVSGKRDSRGGRRVDAGVGREDIAHVGDRAAAVVARSRQHRLREFGRAGRLVVGEVDQVVVGKLRMKCQVVESLQRSIEHLWHAGNRLGVEHAVAYDPQTAGALRDQHVPVGQEHERIRPDQTLHDDNAEFGSDDGAAARSSRRRVEHEWPVLERVPHGGRLLRRQCHA